MVVLRPSRLRDHFLQQALHFILYISCHLMQHMCDIDSAIY
jgi:hypothetical protein